jgi:hypothetical protein
VKTRDAKEEEMRRGEERWEERRREGTFERKEAKNAKGTAGKSTSSTRASQGWKFQN